MIFKSEKKSQIVWDKDAGKALAKFEDGLFRSTDSAVIQKMQAAGYAGDPEPDDESDAELELLRERAKELGISNADRKGEKRLREEIVEAEGAAALLELRAKAAALGIEEVEKKDAATIQAEIAQKGGGGNGGD